MSKPDELLDLLSSQPNTTFPAPQLAARLGVSTRTIRNYVGRLNRGSRPLVVASHSGYRLADPVRESRTPPEQSMSATPAIRRACLTHTLLSSRDGIDVFEQADVLHVSESTVEADLGEIRRSLSHYDLTVTRKQSRLAVSGSESARRRAMRNLLTSAAVRRNQYLDIDSLVEQTGMPQLAEFRKHLYPTLARHDLTANQRTADELTAHVAVLVERIIAGHEIRDTDNSNLIELAPVAEDIATLIEDTFSVRLGAPERSYLSLLLTQKTAPEDPTDASSPNLSTFLNEHYASFVHDILEELSANYMVDLEDERFVGYLALHIKNLVERASRSEVAPLPVGQSVKNTHPLVHELAVFIARQIEHGTGITVAEDEIAFLAFHVGGRLQAMHERDAKVRVTLVAPRYYDLQTSLSTTLAAYLQPSGVLTDVITEINDVTPSLDCDLLITTVPLRHAPSVPMVLISALPTLDDFTQVRALVSEVAEGQRRFRTTAWLTSVLDPSLFVTMPSVTTPDQTISTLSMLLESEGYVDSEFVKEVLERERLSPTSFPSGAAIPHSIEMSALRSAIAIGILTNPVMWDGVPVNFIALLAVAEDSREQFSEVYEAFIRTLISSEKVQKLRQRSDNFDSFVQELISML